MRRHVIAFGGVLILGGLQSWSQESAGGPTVTLKVEVRLPDGAAFYIPAVGDGEMVGIVPLLKGRFAGIRITPRMRVDSVQIEVSALTATNKKLSESTVMKYGHGVVKTAVFTREKRMHRCRSRGWLVLVFPFSQ